MVDAATMAGLDDSSRRSDVVSSAAGSQTFSATVHQSAEHFLARCKELELHAPAQSELWVSTWIEEVQPETILVTVEQDGQTVFAFGLQELRKGTFKIARVLGLTHANGNFFPLSPALRPSEDRNCVEAAIQAVREQRPDIHALVFERLISDFAGRRNPLLALPSQTSPNVALSVDLTPGFEAVLNIGNGQRKRKRHRYQARKLEAIGTVKQVRPRNAPEVAPVIDAFLDMKAARLRQMGTADVFGPEPIRRFFRTLFTRSVETPTPAFQLDALEVGGKIRAVTGSSLSGDRIICDFAAFADDESAAASPGDYLLHNNIRDATAAGFAIYDLGVGDEPYKRSWCDIETAHHDVFVALTHVGLVLVAAQRAKTRLKAAIKGNARLWQLAKTLRSTFTRAEQKPLTPPDDR
jgi:CelD/BcsL family acetyltransferase involved in cellulose biosynthesis